MLQALGKTRIHSEPATSVLSAPRLETTESPELAVAADAAAGHDGQRRTRGTGGSGQGDRQSGATRSTGEAVEVLGDARARFDEDDDATVE